MTFKPRLPILIWLRNISIAKKLYFMTGIMALLILVELFALGFSISTLSSIRAYVGAEGLYSKSQKDAMYHLNKYAYLGDEKDYKSFQLFMKVPLGDNRARVELEKEKFNYEIARQGFVDGLVHPDDIDGVIKVFRRFRKIYYIDKAISIWAAADPIISKLIPIGEHLHNEISSGSPSKEKIKQLLLEITPINEQLTKLENDFSYTLGEGSRWLEALVFKMLLSIALTVETAGLLLTISVSRGISKGINEIIRVSEKIANTDFSEKATIYSKDEIGKLALSFNHMSNKLEHNIEERKKVEDALIKSKLTTEENAKELNFKNIQLVDFCNIVSHNFRAPLTNISMLVDFAESCDDITEKEECLSKIKPQINHLNEVLNELVESIQIRNHTDIEQENNNIEECVTNILQGFENQINSYEGQVQMDFKGATIITCPNKYLNSILTNLISNALKYKSPERNPIIKIKTERKNGSILLSVEDNGVGINLELHKNRIFKLKQVFHNHPDAKGFGLFLTKTHVEAMGGKIWAESKINLGTTFFVEFNNQKS